MHKLIALGLTAASLIAAVGLVTTSVAAADSDSPSPPWLHPDKIHVGYTWTHPYITVLTNVTEAEVQESLRLHRGPFPAQPHTFYGVYQRVSYSGGTFSSLSLTPFITQSVGGAILAYGKISVSVTNVTKETANIVWSRSSTVTTVNTASVSEYGTLDNGVYDYVIISAEHIFTVSALGSLGSSTTHLPDELVNFSVNVSKRLLLVLGS